MREIRISCQESASHGESPSPVPCQLGCQPRIGGPEDAAAPGGKSGVALSDLYQRLALRAGLV